MFNRGSSTTDREGVRAAPTETEAGALTATLGSSSSPGSVPGRVLVVEDQSALRFAVRDLLLENRYQVDVAADGIQALESVNRSEPDVVLMDMRMPGTDGADATLQIKAQFPLVQVIAFTSYDDPATKKLMEQQGVFRYLVKGVSTASIIEAVSQALDNKRRIQGGWEQQGARF
jgi:CheY-like chemotaxis protein